MAARHCPYCEHQFEAGREFEGYLVACPHCNKRIVVHPTPDDAGESSQPDKRAARAAVPSGNELAILSLVLGLGSYLCVGPLLSVPGAIVGYIALDRSVRRHEIPARLMAMLALAVNIVNLALSAIILPMMWFP